MRVEIPEGVQDPFSELGNYHSGAIVASAKTFSQTVYQKTQLSLRIFEGARARTAEINGCMVCRAFRAKRDLGGMYEKAGADASGTVIGNGAAPDEGFYQNVSNWRTYPGFDDRERVAIEFAERFCNEPQVLAKDDAYWSRARNLFSDEEIVDLSHCVASFISTGRVAHVLGLDRVCSIPTIGELA